MHDSLLKKLGPSCESGVHSIEDHVRTVWVKFLGDNKKNIVTICARALGKIRVSHHLNANGALSPQDRLDHEFDVLTHCASLDLPTPRLLGRGAHYFVMEDVGIRIDQLPGHRIDERLLCDVFSSLAQLHQKGIAHGRCRLKDICVKEDQPSWIDFEEAIEGCTPQLQARDVFLLLSEISERSELSDSQTTAALLLWRSAVQPAAWRALFRIGTLLFRIRWLFKAILFFKPTNRLSRNLLHTSHYLRNLGQTPGLSFSGTGGRPG